MGQTINISFLIQDDNAIKQKRKSRKLRDVVIFDYTTSLRSFGGKIGDFAFMFLDFAFLF
jgi:hypothetical protein